MSTAPTASGERVHDLGADRRAELLGELFRRSSAAAHLAGDSTVREPLSPVVLLAHVHGRKRAGAIPFVDAERVGWGAIDLDSRKWGSEPDDPEVLAMLDSIVQQLASDGLRGIVERSRSKGWHVWVFFGDGLAKARDVRAYLRDVALSAGARDEADLVCPRSDERGDVGNGTYLPLFGDVPPHTWPHAWNEDGDLLPVESSELAGFLREVIDHPTPASAVPRVSGREERARTPDDHACAWIVDELAEKGVTLEAAIYLSGSKPDHERLNFACPFHHAPKRRRRGGSAVMWADGRGTCSSCGAKWSSVTTFLARLNGDEGGAAPEPRRLEAHAFSGGRLLGLLDRPAPAPVEAGIPVPGHLTLVVAPPMTGKTSQALWLAMARAAGVAPFPGASVPEQGRVLLLSIDEAPEQVARRMRGLSIFHPAGRLEPYAERLVVLGPDREVPPEALDALRFDDAGLASLGAWLDAAAADGEPFTEVYIDAYADMLPIGESESSNEAATVIGGALERIAVRTGAAVVLLHHCGKPRVHDAGDVLPDVRFMGRGASALAAKARVVFALELVSGFPHLRRIRTVTNLSRPPKPALFEVCSQEADSEELLYFRPHDPIADRRPEELLEPGEDISTNALAWRLSGRDPESGRQPPGECKTLAAALRERWRRGGLVEVLAGKNRAKLIRLVTTENRS